MPVTFLPVYLGCVRNKQQAGRAPRLLAAREDVHLRRASVGILERADANERGLFAHAAVVTPQRDLAGGAAHW